MRRENTCINCHYTVISWKFADFATVKYNIVSRMLYYDLNDGELLQLVIELIIHKKICNLWIKLEV